MAANNAENFCMLKSCLLPEELSKAELESETTWATWSALDLPVSGQATYLRSRSWEDRPIIELI